MTNISKKRKCKSKCKKKRKPWHQKLTSIKIVKNKNLNNVIDFARFLIMKKSMEMTNYA